MYWYIEYTVHVLLPFRTARIRTEKNAVLPNDSAPLIIVASDASEIVGHDRALGLVPFRLVRALPRVRRRALQLPHNLAEFC